MNILLGVALAVAVGGVTFAAGRLTAPASATAAAGTGRGGAGIGLPQASGGPGAGGFPGGGLGGATALVVQGTVQTVGADSITLVTAAGATIEVPLQAETTYHGQSPAVATDVKPGQEVRIDLAAAAGVGGFRGGAPGGSANPAPVGGSGAPVGGGRAFGSALDVTIVTP